MRGVIGNDELVSGRKCCQDCIRARPLNQYVVSHIMHEVLKVIASVNQGVLISGKYIGFKPWKRFGVHIYLSTLAFHSLDVL